MRALFICSKNERLRSLGARLKDAGHEVKDTGIQTSMAVIGRDHPDILFVPMWETATWEGEILSLSDFFLSLRQLYSFTLPTGHYPVVIAITNHAHVGGDVDLLYKAGFDLTFEMPIRESVLLGQLMAFDRRLGISSRTLASPHLLVDLHTHHVFLKTNQGTILTRLNLGQIPFILLKCFLQYPQRIWTRTELLDQLNLESGHHNHKETVDIRVVDSSMYRLRKCIKDALEETSEGWWIDHRYKEGFFHTERAGGYYFLDTVSLLGELHLVECLPAIAA